ncbi:hypothetical protein VTK56DRAFT_9316 [Thermocarpiscus australiensis]
MRLGRATGHRRSAFESGQSMRLLGVLQECCTAFFSLQFLLDKVHSSLCKSSGMSRLCCRHDTAIRMSIEPGGVVSGRVLPLSVINDLEAYNSFHSLLIRSNVLLILNPLLHLAQLPDTMTIFSTPLRYIAEVHQGTFLDNGHVLGVLFLVSSAVPSAKPQSSFLGPARSKCLEPRA